MEDQFEKGYAAGKNMAAQMMLRLAIKDLEGDRTTAQISLIQLETEAALRRLCRDLDLDPPEDAHPADIVEKWIWPNIVRREKP